LYLLNGTVMVWTEFARKRGIISECKYQRLKLAWDIQQSGLKEKDAKLKFNVSHTTYWRLKKLKVL
jgi:hypothetical protein